MCHYVNKEGHSPLNYCLQLLNLPTCFKNISSLGNYLRFMKVACCCLLTVIVLVLFNNKNVSDGFLKSVWILNTFLFQNEGCLDWLFSLS